ncbi:hypothetical protein PILCRDRAFT_256026 [Piloderma croceum F 1598]|uniref:Uncharacterized protein n=1 Tax=Piloderma croceum (strain F 1598) TaxID=765440 RepID=A0A0C3CF73_PILCF|nr:hypothetical protein PILCRDRAFT_256026 [Piloderma croceum F 1598]
MSLGRVTDIKWIYQGKVQTGGFCTAQGVIQQLGETGSALTTLTIAIHIFVVVMRRSRNDQPLKYEHIITCAVVSLTWLFITLFVAISVSVHTHGFTFYEQPVGFWCWISNQHKAEQYAGQYIWVWVTVFGSFLAYTPLFLLARGNITIDETHWWRFKIERGESRVQIQINDPDDWRRRSIEMLAYPLVFAAITLPVSVVRWRSGFGNTLPHLATATFVTEFIYSLSGTLNVLLLVFTHSKLLRSQGGRSGLTPDITGILAENSQGQRMSLRLLPRTTDLLPSDV